MLKRQHVDIMKEKLVCECRYYLVK